MSLAASNIIEIKVRVSIGIVSLIQFLTTNATFLMSVAVVEGAVVVLSFSEGIFIIRMRLSGVGSVFVVPGLIPEFVFQELFLTVLFCDVDV